MVVKLALRKNDKRLLARCIQLWSGSIYSHCELVIDGFCYSSSVMDKGVRKKQIYLDPEKWDVFDLPWAEADVILRYFKKTDGYSYGWFSLITSQLFNTARADDDSQFCSEWCAAALGLPNPSSYSPESLYDSCVWLSELLLPKRA